MLATSIAALRKLSMTLDVTVDGRRAFGIGDGVKATLLARVLGLASTDIRFSDLVSLLRSRGAARREDRQ